MKSFMKSNFRKAALGVAIAALTGTVSAAVTWDGTLPVEGNPLTSQQYQDFTIYSMNYLTYLADQNRTSSSPYYGLAPAPTYNVDSSPGKLHPTVVIVTGNDGTVANNLDTCGGTAAGSGCDSAYSYPSSSSSFFTTQTAPESPVVVPGESTSSVWTATSGALRTFLDGNDLVFMFNLNEQNGGDANTLTGQSLLVSMKVDLTDSLGNILYTYYVGANNAIGLPQTAKQAWDANGAPVADPTAPGYNPQLVDAGGSNGWYSSDPRWAYVHGAISVDLTTGAFLGMGDCNYTGFANCKTINQNLGAEQVAFAAFNQDLSDRIYNDSQVAFMNVTYIDSGQDNGFQQLFIMAGTKVTQVPEPASLALLGLALAAFGVVRRRRNMAS